MCYVAFLVAVGFSISQVNWVKHIVDTNPGITGLTQGFMPADIDGDEFADFVAHTNDTVVWYEDDGAWNFTKYVIGPADDGDKATSCVYPCDLDKDGDMDVLVATAGLGLGWYKNENKEWSWCPIDTMTPEGYHRVLPADLNEDPYTDLIAIDDSVNGAAGIVYTFINDGNQVFTKYDALGNREENRQEWRVLTFDNGYGNDLLFSIGRHPWGGFSAWMDSSGNGTAFMDMGSPEFGDFDGCCLLDVDMDEAIEIIVGGCKLGWKNQQPDTYAFYFAEEWGGWMPTLEGTQVDTFPSHTQGVAGYDVNSDGFPDLVGVGQGKIRWFEHFPHSDSLNFTLHEIDDLNNSHWVYADDLGNMCVTDSGAHIIYELLMLRVISPNGGENWAGGETHNIVWGAPDNVTPANYFRLSYSTDGGSTYLNEIAADISYDSTSWEWTLPIINCDSCLVKVELFDNTKSLLAWETSNFNFTIEPHVEILDTVVDPGDTVDIAIYLTDVTGLGINSFDITLRFNQPYHGHHHDPIPSGLLTALSAKVGSLTENWDIEGSSPSSDSNNIRIKIGGFGDALEGSGSLAIVSFVVDDSTTLPGDTSRIRFRILEFNEDSIAHGINGTATVSGVRVNISGDCRYWYESRAVRDVDMDLSGDHFNNVKTDSFGHYSFPAESEANYTVTPSKGVQGGHHPPTVKVNDAVTAHDAYLVLKHVVELDTFVNNECVAANVSGDSTISAYDASLILRYSVELIDSFPAGNWTFKPESTSYMPIVSDTTENYTAILYGDVTGNWGESKCLAYKGDPVSVSIPRIFVAPAETVDVPIQVGDIMNYGIFSCYVNLTFDSTFVTALNAKKGALVSTGWSIKPNLDTPGKIIIALASKGDSLKESGELVVVSFVVDAGAQAGDSTIIHFSKVMFNEYAIPTDLHDGWLGMSVGAEAMPRKIPKVFFASQNCPNPFIGSTNIEYGLPKTADVEISIYNLLGQKVTTLVDENKKAGYHQVKWDGKDKHGKKVATGIYFYRMEAGDFKATKKLTILK